MKFLRKSSRMYLPILLVAAIFLAWMVVQHLSVTPDEVQAAMMQAQGKKPSSPTPPAQVQEREKAENEGKSRAARKGPRNTRESVLQKLRPTGNARPASPSPPRQEQEREAIEKKAPARGARPTKDSLLNKIRARPGGQQLIDDAKRRGAPIAKNVEKPGFFASLLNAFKLETVHAQATFSVSLDPSNNWYSSNPYASLYGYGATDYSYMKYLYNYDYSAYWGTQVVKPAVYFAVNIPADGWYIINMEGYHGGPISLKHYDYGTYTYPTVTTFAAGGSSSPALLELAAGYHYFIWVADSSYAYVYEVNAFSLN